MQNPIFFSASVLPVPLLSPLPLPLALCSSPSSLLFSIVGTACCPAIFAHAEPEAQLFTNPVVPCAACCVQLTEFFTFNIFYYVVIGYSGLVVVHAIITTRDGYCVSISNMAGARLRRWRRDPRGCCGAGWTPLIWVLERIGASSARPVAQEYLAPYHMKVGGGFLVGVGCC